MSELRYEITETVGVLAEGSKGWQKEINLISWNSRTPKIDIRDWSPQHEKMGKGVTLNKEELKNLKDLLNDLDIDKLNIE